MYGNCLAAIAPEYNLFFSLFVGGIVGSFSHCTGMCGPFVLGQIGALPSHNKTAVTMLLLPYHFGRITTYMMLAAVFSGLVNFAAIYALPKTVLSVFLLGLAGLMFLVAAVPALAATFPWLARITLPVPSALLARLSRPFAVNAAGWRGYVLGLMLGFMPCGLVIAALMAASTAANPATAALAMLAFGLGTVPMLVAIAFGGGWVKRRWPAQTAFFSAALMATNSFMLFWLASGMVFQ